MKRLVLLSVVILILIRLVIYQNYLLGREYYFYSDDAIYAALSKKFLAGDFWSAFHPYWSPGLSLASIPFYLVSQSWEKAQFLVSVFSSTLLIFVVFWFFKRYSLSFAFIVAFITTFSISLQQLVVTGGITEPLYILLLWSGIFFSWLALKLAKKQFFVWSGVFFGLAYLTRAEVIAILALFLFISFLRFIFMQGGFRKKLGSWIVRATIVVFFFLLVNTPYISFQSLQLGRLTLSGKYAFFGTGPYYALEEDRMTTLAQDVWSTDYIDYSSPYFNPKRTTDYMFKQLKNGSMTQYAKKLFLESLQLYKSEGTNNFFVGFGLYMALLGFAFGVLISKFRMLTIYLSLLWLVGLIWVSFFMAAHYRYLVYALPFFFYLQGLAIYGIGWLAFFIARLFSAPSIVRILVLILPVFLLADFFLRNMSLKAFTTVQFTGGNKYHKIIGEYIKSQNIKVMGGRVEAIPFYANAKLVYMPSSPPEDIIRYMKAWGVEYLLVRPMEVGYDFVAPIADPKFKHPDLTLLTRFDEGSLIWSIRLTEEESNNNLRLTRERKL